MSLIKRSWPRFSEPLLCFSQICGIIIVKFSNSSIQNLFIFDKSSCVKSRKMIRDILKEKTRERVTITNELIIVNPFDTPPKNCAKRKKEEKK